MTETKIPSTAHLTQALINGARQSVIRSGDLEFADKFAEATGEDPKELRLDIAASQVVDQMAANLSGQIAASISKLAPGVLSAPTVELISGFAVKMGLLEFLDDDRILEAAMAEGAKNGQEVSAAQVGRFKASIERVRQMKLRLTANLLAHF